MAIVIERISRSGQVIQTHVVDKDRAVIGRGFYCDVLLQDPHIDAEQMEVELDPVSHAFVCRDKQSTNGVWLLNTKKRAVSYKHKRKLSGDSHFFSGQSFALGRTLLRIYSSHHAVPQAKPLSVWEGAGEFLGHWWVALSLLIALVGLITYNSYLSEPISMDLSEHTFSAMYAVLAALLYAGFWAFIGKSLRHDAKFTAHFSLGLIALLLVELLQFSQPLWVFNFGLWHLSDILSDLILAVLLFGLGYISLLLACNFGFVVRLGIALLAPLVVLVSTLLGALAQPEFNPTPNYDRSLVGPGWQMRRTVEPEQFFEAAETLYPAAKKEAEEDQLEESP